MSKKNGGISMDRATIKSMAKEQIKGNIGILFVITLLSALISGALSSIPVVGSVAGVLLGSALNLAMCNIYLNLTVGVKPSVGDLFSQIKNFWPAFKTQFLMGLFTMLWSLLFYIPGIIKACSYSQTMFILAENPTLGAREAIDQSKAMMEGHKMEYFVLLLSFIGWAILGVFTFGILCIWLMPYMEATFANFYKSVKSGSYAG